MLDTCAYCATISALLKTNRAKTMKNPLELPEIKLSDVPAVEAYYRATCGERFTTHSRIRPRSDKRHRTLEVTTVNASSGSVIKRGLYAITSEGVQTRRYLAIHNPSSGLWNVGLFDAASGEDAARAACDAWGIDLKYWPQIHIKAPDCLFDGWQLFLTDEDREK